MSELKKTGISGSSNKIGQVQAPTVSGFSVFCCQKPLFLPLLLLGSPQELVLKSIFGRSSPGRPDLSQRFTSRQSVSYSGLSGAADSGKRVEPLFSPYFYPAFTLLHHSGERVRTQACPGTRIFNCSNSPY